MADKYKEYFKSVGIVWKITIYVSLVLLIAGFCLPPTGVIDNSVLIAVGMMGVIIDIPLIFSKKVSLSADLDDKKVTLSTEDEKEKLD